jgi:lysylphosphatidylglycerol synthetase-like protein (DUF2156 family)
MPEEKGLSKKDSFQFPCFELELLQYSRILQVRRLLSGIVLILTVFWVFRTAFAVEIPLKEDPIRIVLVVFIVIFASTVLGTHFYKLLDSSNKEMY